MKTKNNIQETANNQVSKFSLRAGAVLLGAVLVSASVDAQDLWNQLSNSVSYGKMSMVMDAQSSETNNADAAIEVINSEFATLLSGANESFVSADVEEPMNVESWMTEEAFFREAEQYTAETSGLEIAKYTEKLINAEREEALEIENWMTNEKFFQDADRYTAEGSDLEIAKYADKMKKSMDEEKDLNLESNLTDENFLMEAEQYTADGVESEIARYAKKLIDLVETEEAMTVESWMLNTDRFNNRMTYAHHEVR